MRILHLTPRYHPVQGGAERYWREISNRLAARGHDVTILTSDADHFEYFWDAGQSRLANLVAQDGRVKIRRLPIRHWPGSPRSYQGLRRLLWLGNEVGVPAGPLAKLAQQTPRFPALWHYLATLTEPFDLVAAINVAYEQFGLAGYHFARQRSLPFVYYPLTHLGTGPTPASDKLSRFYTQNHQLKLARESDALVTITPTEAGFYAKQGVAPERIHVAEPGFNVEVSSSGVGERWRQRYQIEKPIILFLGTLSHDKGCDHLVAAAQLLWQQGEQFNLVLAGRPTQELRFADLPHLMIRANISNDEKADLLAAADLLALPSRVESFGIVFQEAWAYKTPVIAARTWGIREDVIRHELDGLLVDFGDVVGLSRAIQRLLGDASLRQRLGNNGYVNLATRYSWRDKIDIIDALYRSPV